MLYRRCTTACATGLDSLVEGQIRQPRAQHGQQVVHSQYLMQVMHARRQAVFFDPTDRRRCHGGGESAFLARAQACPVAGAFGIG